MGKIKLLTKNNKMKRVTNIDAHVGKKLKLIRIERGYSQAEIGKMMNITFQQIQKYEKGDNRVSSGKLYEFSKILKVPVAYFFEDIDENEKSFNEEYKKIGYNKPNKEILVISRLLNTLEDKKKKQNLIETIKNLIKLMR